MQAFAAFLDEPETSLRKPILDARVFVQPKDRDAAPELNRQGAWIGFMRKTAVLAFSIPNGTHIATQWGRNKADREGRYTGFPDTAAVWQGGTAYLEWKDGKGNADPAQIECLNRLVEMGYPCAVVRTRAAAVDWLRSLGAPVS